MEITVWRTKTPGATTHTTFVIGYDRGKSEMISFNAETPLEEHALREIAGALEQVLPENSVHLDIDPVMKSDGHGGVEPTGNFRVGIRIFAKPIVVG